MPQHVMTGSPVGRIPAVWADLLAWHDRRPRAPMASVRGWVWTTLAAASFFWMSNPLVFVRIFDDSLRLTTVCTLGAAVLTLRWLRLPRVPWPWIAFLGMCALSQIWSVNAAATATSVLLYLHMTALALIVAANCESMVAGWGFALGGVVVVALSVYGYEKTMWGSSYPIVGGFAFTGVGTNENILAYTLAISFAATLAVARRRHWSLQVAWLSVLCINSYGLYLANSGTGYLAVSAVVVAGLSIVVWPTLSKARRRVGVIWVSAVAFLLIASLALVAIFMGKQVSTVSGRSPFWAATFGSTMDRAPLLGSGWGAVWEHPWDLKLPNEVALDIYARAGFTLAHGHNFFVDVLPELGLLGVAIAVLMVGYAAREIRRCGLQPGSADPVTGRLVLLVLVALLVSGVSEPMLTVPLGWWCLTLVVALPRQRAPQPGQRHLPVRGGRRRARHADVSPLQA